MKKLTFFLILIMTLTLFACGKTEENNNKDNEMTEEELKAYNDFQQIKLQLDKDIPDVIYHDITIRMRIDGYGLDWISSNPDILPLTGKVNRTEEDVRVTLTARLSYFSNIDKFEKEVIIKKKELKDMENKKLTFAYLYDNKVRRIEDYKQIDIINYSFGLIRDGKLSLHERPQIKEFVRESHNHGVRVVLAIGGWGADGFSDAALTKESRKKFIDSIIDAVKEYDLDGIDYDWEYPTIPAADTKARKEDLENFTKLVSETRDALDKHKPGLILSSAFAGGVWTINSAYQVKELNKYLDYFHIMTYDVEEQNRATHHSALYKSKAATTSADQSIQGYINAGASPEKVVIGAAFYGKTARLKSKVEDPLGRASEWVRTGDNSFHALKKNYIDKYPENVYFDEEAQAPYYFDGELFITYDDERSIKAKSQYVLEHNLGGIMFWSLTGDNTGLLLNTIDENLNK